jgi:hypothetical protein
MVGLAEAIENSRNVFIAELREHLGLAPERRDRLLLCLATGKAVDHLRERAAPRRQPQILGEVDEFHTATADRPDHPITSADYGVGIDHLDLLNPQ